MDGAIWHPSPNFGERRNVSEPELVVLHYTAMKNTKAALERLCTPKFEVSTHYLISIDGTLFQLVGEDKRAWHAGSGVWRGKSDINSRSIGIELDNEGDKPFSEAQMVVLEHLLRSILSRWRIPSENVIGHSDFAVGRKIDPGPKFDWCRLAHQGLSVWPESDSVCELNAITFAGALAEFGYPKLTSPDSDQEFKLLLQAFRIRFAPWRQNDLTAADTAEAVNLAQRFG